jgi:hypothetical protein
VSSELMNDEQQACEQNFCEQHNLLKIFLSRKPNIFHINKNSMSMWIEYSIDVVRFFLDDTKYSSKYTKW